ncbi:fasciclin domain-containing protein [bacterium]|nr:fasciclin domain-containing protein [Planctomycetota bacterium]MDB4538551.1 fasciclin domain-containing protein [bacterium]MDB4736281.1 fasciclin domain-containing protein [Planctomycetota bacterium]
MKLTFALTGFALAAASFASTGSDDAPCSQTCSSTPRAALASNAVDDIVTTAVKAGSFNTLAAALKSAELIGALQGEGPFTVFAPTDAAFAKLPKGTVESLLEEKNRGALTGILTYHVVAGDVRSKQIVKDELTTATTLNGQRLDIVIDEGTVTIDGATVVTADIVCSNGVIHVIDTVMLPQSKNLAEVATAAGSFGTLLAAAKAAGLVDALTKGGPFTVFAPTDEAFAKLPEGTVATLLKPENKAQLAAILKHHIVSGRVYADQAAKLDKAPTIGGTELAIAINKAGAKIGNANIVATDIEASNGVIHVIDTVLLP